MNMISKIQLSTKNMQELIIMLMSFFSDIVDLLLSIMFTFLGVLL